MEKVSSLLTNAGISITQKNFKDCMFIFKKILLVDEYPFYREVA